VVDIVEYPHRGFWLVFNPVHILNLKIKQDRDIVCLTDRPVAVQIGSFKRIRNDGPVLNTGQIFVTGVMKSNNASFELPWSCIRAREGKMPRNVVFYYGGGFEVQMRTEIRKLHEPFVILDRVFRLRPQDSNFSFRHF
jgi:hypothetical protein